MIQKIINGEICPYCNCETELVSDKEIYGPNSNYGGKYYRCLNDKDHYVGTYSNNQKSLGRVANKELRQWKMRGHKTFDPLWNTDNSIFEKQQDAYSWLSEQMKLEMKYTHFGMFTIKQCQDAIKYCQELKVSKNPLS